MKCCSITAARKRLWSASLKLRELPIRTRRAKEGDWSTVDLAAVKPLARPVTLREIKANSRLKGIPLVRQSRLSVMPLAEPEFREIVNMCER